MKPIKFYALPFKKSSFKKALRGSLSESSPETFSFLAILSGILAALLSITALKLGIFPEFKYSIVYPVLFFILFYTLTSLHPFMVARRRKTNIDLNLPHAITCMQSLADFVPLFAIFREVAGERELYREISEEFAFIVRDVELLGEDILTSIRNLTSSTPSENLKEFLEGLIISYESGGSLKTYLSNKSEHFREQGRRQLEQHLKTLEILSEVYVTMFVAMPIFLIVMISAMSLLGKPLSPAYFIYLYFFIPVGSILLIYIIDVMNIKEDLTATRIQRNKKFYPASLVSALLKVHVPKRGNLKKIITLPLHALHLNYYNSLYLSIPLMGLFYFWFKDHAFHFRFETLSALTLVVFCTPLMLSFEHRSRFIRRVEKDIPVLLRQILSLKEAGLTLPDVIGLLKDSRIGVLSREMKIVDADLKWGATITDAFYELVNRVGIASVKKIISLMLRANEILENIRDTVITAVEDFEYELKMKNDRFTTGFTYLVIIYLSFFTLLYTVYALQVSFLTGFKNISVSTQGVVMMYRISLILAVFSGLIAGEMEKGHLLYGLKHVCTFTLSSFIVFEYLIGGGIGV